jgi:ABC-type multidrug transport system, ATPase and permease components
MKEFIKVMLRLVPPYKKFLFFNIFNNILSTIFSLFSFGLIIPILQILFGINKASYNYIPFGSTNSLKDEFMNNFYYYITHTIDVYGGGVVLMLLGLLLIFMTLLKTGTAYLALYNMIPLRTGVVRDIRNSIFNKIVGLPIGFFSNERKGDIIARMSGDVNEVESSIMSSIDMIFKNPVMIIVYLITMFALSWQLTLFVLVLLPVSGYIMGQVGKKLKRASLEGQHQWGELMAQLEETLGGLRIIKAFNAEEKIKTRFDHQNNLFRKTTVRINRRQSLAHPMSEFLGTVTIAIVLWYGGTLILNHSSSINAASFIYYIVIFYSIINPAKDLSKAVYSIQKGMASMERIDKIMKAENNIKDPQQPVALKEFSEKIEFKNMYFKYNNEWVLKNINLEIPKGKSIALVGQSGSGKSTMVDLIPRFYDVIDGGIYLDGNDIRHYRVHDLRAQMGNVNQEAILFNDSFFNNIAFGVENATMEKVIEAAKIANAHEFIISSELGYETNIGDRGCKLSGGQRQRLSIARAILKNPPILILDEATSALDTESERLVQDAIENLMRNRTSIVIAHRLSTIKNADLICVMHEGEIVERGRHDELIELDGYYKRLCDMQSF